MAAADYSRGYGKVIVNAGGAYVWAPKVTNEVKEDEGNGGNFILDGEAAEDDESDTSVTNLWVPARFYYDPVREFFRIMLSAEDSTDVLGEGGRKDVYTHKKDTNEVIIKLMLF